MTNEIKFSREKNANYGEVERTEIAYQVLFVIKGTLKVKRGNIRLFATYRILGVYLIM